LIIIGLVLSTLNYSFGQSGFIEGPNKEGRSFPEDLLTTTTVVIMDIPDEQYLELSQISQEGFRRAGVDAVAYIKARDLYAGMDVTPAFLEDLQNRKVQNVAIIRKEGSLYKVTIGKFSGDRYLIDESYSNWTITGGDFEYLFTTLYREAANSSLERTNRLVIDLPEFFTDTNVIRGNRRPSHYLNLKLHKMAVPLFTSGPDTLEMNNRLRKIFKEYPYEYVFVDPFIDPMELRKELDCQVILRHITTNQSTIMQLLDYDEVLESNRIVYKFYIKHILTGNVFLGPGWDASSSWEKALRDHLQDL